MINFLISNDVNSGILNIKDNSTDVAGVSQGIIKIDKLGFKQSFTGSTTPKLNDFLNSSLSIVVPVTSRVDEILDVEYILLKLIDTATYTSGGNSINKVGIFTETNLVRYVYIGDSLYEIDKLASQANQLIVKKAITNTGAVYAAFYVRKCSVSLYDIPKLVKTLTLTHTDCACKSCGDTIAKIDSAHRYLEALTMTSDLDCDERKAFMKCLKELLQIC